MAKLTYKSYADLAKTIHNSLPRIADGSFDLIVGIPRSGMVPAYMIGQDLNISVCSFDELINNNSTSRGNRITKNMAVKTTHDAKKILVVEDAYGGGHRFMAKIASLPHSIRKKVTTLAIYSATESPTVDMYFELVPYPRVFEWNILHHDTYTGQSCYDMDGVLCEDPTTEQNDDGSKYLKFIMNAQPKYVPTYMIKTIITSRLEKYRKPTEAWLKKHGVEFEKLVMLDGYSAEERLKSGIHGRFKAQEYAKDDYALFVESNYNQAFEINHLTGKPVYCVDDNILIDNPKVEIERVQDKIAKLKTIAKSNVLLRTASSIPYRVARKTYRFYKEHRNDRSKGSDIYKQIFPTQKLDKRVKVISTGFGDDGNEYALASKAVDHSNNDNFIVFSAGIFDDIEFEKFMIDRFNATVYSFDPTPFSRKFVDFQIKSRAVSKKKLVHTMCGVESYDGITEFNVTDGGDGGVGSSAIDRVDENGKYYPRKIKVKMKTVKTLMKQKGIDHIDCMKLDIEGSEFAVIQDVFGIGEPIKIPNIIIEFHERFFEDGVARMEQAFQTMRDSGYVHVWTSKLGIECLFVHKDYL